MDRKNRCEQLSLEFRTHLDTNGAVHVDKLGVDELFLILGDLGVRDDRPTRRFSEPTVFLKLDVSAVLAALQYDVGGA